MALDDKIFRQTSPIKRKGMIRGSAPAVPPVEKQDQPTATKGKGRPPIDDEANLDEMERLISQGIAISANAAAKMVAERIGGQSVEATKDRLRKKYAKRIRWENKGYWKQFWNLQGIPESPFIIDEYIEYIKILNITWLIQLGRRDEVPKEVEKFDDKLFEIFPELLERLKRADKWGIIKNWLYSELYNDMSQVPSKHPMLVTMEDLIDSLGKEATIELLNPTRKP